MGHSSGMGHSANRGLQVDNSPSPPSDSRTPRTGLLAPLLSICSTRSGGTPSNVWFEGVQRPVRAVRAKAATAEKHDPQPCQVLDVNLSALSGPAGDRRPDHSANVIPCSGDGGAGLNENLALSAHGNPVASPPTQPPCPVSSSSSMPMTGRSNASTPSPASMSWSSLEGLRSRSPPPPPRRVGSTWSAPFPRSRGWCRSSIVTRNEEGADWPDRRG
jgi:hypothetical protein